MPINESEDQSFIVVRMLELNVGRSKGSKKVG